MEGQGIGDTESRHRGDLEHNLIGGEEFLTLHEQHLLALVDAVDFVAGGPKTVFSCLKTAVEATVSENQGGFVVPDHEAESGDGAKDGDEVVHGVSWLKGPSRMAGSLPTGAAGPARGGLRRAARQLTGSSGWCVHRPKLMFTPAIREGEVKGDSHPEVALYWRPPHRWAASWAHGLGHSWESENAAGHC